MSQYKYKAIDSNGEVETGIVEAASSQEAVRLLLGKKITVIDIGLDERVQGRGVHRKLSSQVLIMAMHELVTLLESGVPLAVAVDAEAKGSHHPVLANAFSIMSQKLKQGESLLEAFKSAELDLPDYFFQLIQAGELTGQLSSSMRRGVEQMEYDLKVASELRNALIYPSILIFSGIAAVLLIFIFVVPKFSNLLDKSRDLPWLANMVLSTGVWFNDNFLIFSIVLACVIFIVLTLFQRKSFRQKIFDILAEAPVIGGWIVESDTAKWASLMGTMLQSRVELVVALSMACEGVRVTRRRGRLEKTIMEVKSGGSLAEALENNSALTPTGYNLVRVGEASGQLAKMLSSLGKLYDESSRARMKQVLILIEPLAILVIGSVIGVLVLGVILAITSVNDVGL